MTSAPGCLAESSLGDETVAPTQRGGRIMPLLATALERAVAKALALLSRCCAGA
jgi:hypothetical protein